MKVYPTCLLIVILSTGLFLTVRAQTPAKFLNTGAVYHTNKNFSEIKNGDTIVVRKLSALSEKANLWSFEKGTIKPYPKNVTLPGETHFTWSALTDESIGLMNRRIYWATLQKISADKLSMRFVVKK